MNAVILSGRLTADVELKQTAGGTSVCDFRLAVRRPNVKDTTDFITCVAWRGTAEFIAKYFSKGDPIAITGVLTAREWEADVRRRYAVEVVIDRAEFVESKRSDGGNTQQEEYELAVEDSDLPF